MSLVFSLDSEDKNVFCKVYLGRSTGWIYTPNPQEPASVSVINLVFSSITPLQIIKDSKFNSKWNKDLNKIVKSMYMHFTSQIKSVI